MEKGWIAAALVLLCGCTQQTAMGTTAAVTYLTRPAEPPPAVTDTQIPEHEVWCYRTMGDVECYTKAQDVHPSRLVNVEPQNLYPLTPEAYADEVAGIRPTLIPKASNEEPSFFERTFGFGLF